MGRGNDTKRLGISEPEFMRRSKPPDLPAIDWSVIDQRAPARRDTP